VRGVAKRRCLTLTLPSPVEGEGICLVALVFLGRLLKKGTGSERPLDFARILVCCEVPVPFFNTLLDD
jgi:hypothetical protein